jgi:putative tricarboxylic transport membrane protein
MAQQYPVPRVNLVTHSSPGGGSDVFLRELVKHLPANQMKTNFVVENVSGGSGAKAMAFVAGSAADGSVFYATTPTHIQVSLLSKPAVSYEALDPIVIVFQDPQLLYTRTESPYKTLADVITFAKANPGKSRWGASNPASEERIAMEKLSRVAGVKVPIVSHEGGADQMIGVLNGTFDIGIGEPQELLSQIEAGKIRVVATLTDKRLSTMPNVPTAVESGYPKLVTESWYGMWAPKGTPADRVQFMNKAVNDAVNQLTKAGAFEPLGLEPVTDSVDDFRKYMVGYVAESAELLKAAGFKPE